MSNWFYGTFLPSLFEMAGINNPMWISQKQTAICTQNMEEHCSVLCDGEFSFKKLYFTCKWDERNVTVVYSKKNGCSTIEFSFNEKEKELHRKEHEAEKARIEMERVARIKRRPERLKRVIDELKKKEEGLIIDLSFDDNTEEDLVFYTKELEKVRKELAIYTN